MSITEACIKKPVFAWMIMAAAVLFGVLALGRIGISQFPDVDFPTINTSITWEGASPEQVESEVLEAIEEALVQVEGIKTISSTARQGRGSVTIELELSRDVNQALQEAQTRISQVARRLPRDIDPPVVSKTNPEDQPIMWVGLSGPLSPQQLADYARYRVKERFQTLPGVGEVTMGGYLDRMVRVWVNGDRLDEYGLTIADVTRALQREHVELPAGRMETSAREINVRVLGEAVDLSTFRKLPVKESASGTVRLEDVALIEDGFEDVRRVARVNGLPAQGMGIRKQRGANAVAVARRVRAEIGEIAKTLPAGMEIGVIFDSTRFIEEAVREIQFGILLAVLLTALVCWLFLGSFSSTLNIVLAIPMSLLGTVACIYFFGFTLNTFTLLALSLAVGIVVDDAIMVMENIFRHGEAGKKRVDAAREGTREITFAALAATIAVVAIFLPVIFVPGITGKFFLQFGVTLSVAVLLSYLEAITLAPARCAQFLDVSREHRTRVGRMADAVFEGLAQRYGRVLAWALRRPGLSVLAGVGVFAVFLGLFWWIPKEFVPSQDQSRIIVRLQTPVGSSLADTDAVFKRAEAVVQARPEVLRFFAVVGGFGGGDVNTGIMFMTLHPPEKRKLSQAGFMAAMRKELNAIPGLRAVIQDLSQAGFTAQRGFPIEFSVRGPNWDTLVQVSHEAMEKLVRSGVAVDLDTDYQVGMPELRLLPDRAKAADLGVPTEQVATTINALVGGVRAGKFTDQGRRLDIRLRLMADQRARPEDITRLRVRTASGALVPLSSVVSTEERPTLQAITRRDRERAITLFGNVAPGHAQQEALSLVESLSKQMPVGYRAVLGGASVAFRDSFLGLVFALVLGIAFAYMVLASQFNSFLHPATVLTILPLAAAGALLGLVISGNTLNVFSFIGLLLLLGIVKKNSIILVDYTNQLRQEGLSTLEAVLRAGPVRLRPILMTTTATLVAALPPAMGAGPGAEIRTPMAAAVIGGLIVSTLLSLVVVPCFYVVADGLKQRLIARRRGAPEPATVEQG